MRLASAQGSSEAFLVRMLALAAFAQGATELHAREAHWSLSGDEHRSVAIRHSHWKKAQVGSTVPEVSSGNATIKKRRDMSETMALTEATGAVTFIASPSTTAEPMFGGIGWDSLQGSQADMEQDEFVDDTSSLRQDPGASPPLTPVTPVPLSPSNPQPQAVPPPLATPPDEPADSAVTPVSATAPSEPADAKPVPGSNVAPEASDASTVAAPPSEGSTTDAETNVTQHSAADTSASDTTAAAKNLTTNAGTETGEPAAPAITVPQEIAPVGGTGVDALTKGASAKSTFSFTLGALGFTGLSSACLFFWCSYEAKHADSQEEEGQRRGPRRVYRKSVEWPRPYDTGGQNGNA